MERCKKNLVKAQQQLGFDRNLSCFYKTFAYLIFPEHDVSGYPTLKFFKAGDSEPAEKYMQARDMDALVKFINKKLGVEVEEVRKLFSRNFRFYPSYRTRSLACGFVTRGLRVHLSEHYLIFKEPAAEPEVAVADKGLYVLNEKSFDGHIKEGDTFVKFYAPWCGHCQVRIQDISFKLLLSS